jgi:hypothetical protein
MDCCYLGIGKERIVGDIVEINEFTSAQMALLQRKR